MAAQQQPIDAEQLQAQPQAFRVRELKIFAFNLNERLQHTRVRKMSGFDRFKRTVYKELQKLQEIQDDTKQYSSTSIFYLTAIWNYCMEIGLNNVQSICKTIKYDDVEHDKKRSVVVDIVCKSKLKWIKIKSKNPYSMQVQILKSDSERSNILTVAEHYIKAAKANKVKFKTPKIEMVFTKGITSDIAYMLKTKGIAIKGTVIADNIFFEDDIDGDVGIGAEPNGANKVDAVNAVNGVNQSDADNSNEQKNENQENENEQNENQQNVQNEQNGNMNESEDDDDEEGIDESAVNLGPKTMMTLISAMANGESHDQFWQIVENYVIQREDNPTTYKSSIYQQALNFTYNSSEAARHKLMGLKSTEALTAFVASYYEEIQYPVMPIIWQYIGNRKMLCCQSAWDSVTRLVGMGAGPNERMRYNQLQQRITVIPDQLSERTMRLKGKGMSKVNKAVFGTGDSLRVLTVSAVPGFVRRARQKGVDYYTKIHDVRPFVEQYQVGFEVFKAKGGFDVEALERKMADEDIDLNFDDDDDDDDSDSEDGDNGGMMVEEEELEEDEFIELNEEFEQFGIAY